MVKHLALRMVFCLPVAPWWFTMHPVVGPAYINAPFSKRAIDVCGQQKK
jgi:hypothetical protein